MNTADAAHAPSMPDDVFPLCNSPVQGTFSVLDPPQLRCAYPGQDGTIFPTGSSTRRCCAYVAWSACVDLASQRAAG